MDNTQNLGSEKINTPIKALIAQRLDKLAKWREGTQAYPNHFRRNTLAADLIQDYDSQSQSELALLAVRVKLAGRIIALRIMGKASFAHLQDQSGRIQLYIRQDQITPDQYIQFKQWDLGDIVGIEGTVFKTKTGELSIQVQSLLLLSKAIRPLPDKYHGLADQEIRYRQRYLDLLANAETRRIFMMRSMLIDTIRQFFKALNFLEVETPMMQVMPGGAAAKPFITHHHALGMPLYLRVSPELYLKRLVVGGFERVFEINRNFRNEGISTQHNPEFTMLEFYQAYTDYLDLMTLTEQLFKQLALATTGKTEIVYQNRLIDFAQPFTRLSIQEAILQYHPELRLEDIQTHPTIQKIAQQMEIPFQAQDSIGQIQMALFEKIVEPQLQQPTFVLGYPIEFSPLARQNNDNPAITDRFELFIAGLEIANGFSELNDPEDQARRFTEQMRRKASGDDEAMFYDEDYIIALEHGLPPTAGEGIGIDRLVMLFTNITSIREIILFPHMRTKT